MVAGFTRFSFCPSTTYQYPSKYTALGYLLVRPEVAGSPKSSVRRLPTYSRFAKSASTLPVPAPGPGGIVPDTNQPRCA